MASVFRLGRWVAAAALVVLLISVGAYTYAVLNFDSDNLPENHGKVHTVLYASEGSRQPLIVGLGGAEGGNAWASQSWKAQRERFVEQGYAFLALGYFGMEGIPRELDRVALDGVYRAIIEAASDPRVNGECIAVIGGSKGAELALALASNFPAIKAVVGIVPGGAVFPAHTIAMNTSSFTLNNEQLPFVPIPPSATPALIAGDLRAAWEKMLENREAVGNASIAVENINGPILFLSATRDEFWPSTEMSEEMVARLRARNFRHRVDHIAVEGDHGAPLNHLDQVEAFLQQTVMQENAEGCPRGD